ncbi:DUF937 domain-containing protein [Siphonobacter curvatus]|uniref:OmpA-like domain-containing protein n=1 Tax=Siphonobacter curvatus TaxID=2094562 RepID=A0A2S7INL8_9BACT|nr:DUF937 domain-containing protein [Siphonobacter curvatus]PQA59322.1 hypothetical protein C5O19_06630 [Siphonobacter curvatus]
MNIFSYLKDYLSADLVEAMASHINEDAGKTRQAAEVTALSVVAAFLKRSSTESGAKAMYKAIERENLYGNHLGPLSAQFRDRDQASQIIQKGSNLFSHLLPDKRSVLIAMIASHARIRSSSATSVLGAMSYLTLDILGKQVKDQNLDPVGLAMVLRNQKDYLIKEADPELLDKVVTTLSIEDMERIGYVTPTEEAEAEVVSRTRTRPQTENPYADLTENPTFPWKAILGGVALLVVLGGGYYAWQQYGSTVQSAALQDTTVTEEVALPTDSTARYPDSTQVATTPATATTPAGESLADKLTQHLNNPLSKAGKTFVFEGITFDPLTNEPTPQSIPALDGLAAVLKKNPNLQLKFTGVTRQAANKKNVFKQANSIKAYLTRAGVDIIRLDVASFVTQDAGRSGEDFIVVKVVQQ